MRFRLSWNLLYIAQLKNRKKLGEEMEIVYLVYRTQNLLCREATAGIQDRKLEAGTEAEAMGMLQLAS